MNAPHTLPFRALQPLPVLLDEINGVDAALDGLCDLLAAAGSGQLAASSLYALLRPLQKRLAQASCDLNDQPDLVVHAGAQR